MPPAPLLLSITTVWPSRSDTSFASSRAKPSLGPPGGKGSTQLTVFSGQSRACAAVAASVARPPRTVRRVVFMRFPLFQLDVRRLGDAIPAPDLLLYEAAEVGAALEFDLAALLRP